MKEKKELILVGGGGHCKSVIEAAESAGFSIRGILDVAENVGNSVLKYKIIGTDEDIPLFKDECDFVVTLGFIKDTKLRLDLHNRIQESGGHLATIVASTAHVSVYASIGAGTVIMHHAMVNADAQIGYGCIINTFANIEHDTRVGNNCHISTGAMVNGNCRVGARTFLGSQSVVVNGVSIVSDCIIAAGSLVRKNLTRSGIYSGSPAVLMKKLN